MVYETTLDIKHSTLTYINSLLLVIERLLADHSVFGINGILCHLNHYLKFIF